MARVARGLRLLFRWDDDEAERPDGDQDDAVVSSLAIATGLQAASMIPESNARLMTEMMKALAQMVGARKNR